MRFTPPEQAVELYKTGFDDEDILGREKAGKDLSDVLERIEDPLVVALDGRWGTGKSYFLQRWVGAHTLRNEGRARTVYFDAFAHDYQSDPLIALVGALSQSILKIEEPKLEKLKKSAFKLMNPVARAGLAVVTQGASEVVGGAGAAVLKSLSADAEAAMSDFWAREEGRQAAMGEFRAAIEALTAPIKASDEPTPLIIVVDELDRCRPDYALEILEVIKHFFAAPHVHFVLGANLNALENSVKARYGPDIDATAYLQKFLSFTLTLPDHVGWLGKTQAIIKYARHVGKKMGTPAHLLEEIETQLEVLSRANHISIRDVGKVLSAVALLPDEARREKQKPVYQRVAINLIIIRVIRRDIFVKFIDASICDEELRIFLGASDKNLKEVLPNREHNDSYDHTTYVLYMVWRFVCRDGKSDGSDDWSRIENFFSDYGPPRTPNGIPQKLYDDWLSVFKLPERMTTERYRMMRLALGALSRPHIAP